MWLDLGPCVRRIAVRDPDTRVFLSFDDGPDTRLTHQVLDVLDEYGAKASFFLIAHKARAHPALVQRMVTGGHAVGNHSLDHDTRRFFRGAKVLRSWVEDADRIISDVAGAPTIGFRSPLGIQTPPLYDALNSLQMPLILWNRRYFDTTLAWLPWRAKLSAMSVCSGDIVLLHDRYSFASARTLIPSLRVFLETLKKKGLTPFALRPEDLK